MTLVTPSNNDWACIQTDLWRRTPAAPAARDRAAQGPLAGQFRASRRRWFEVEYQAKSAMMLSRQALAGLNMFTSTSREDLA